MAAAPIVTAAPPAATAARTRSAVTAATGPHCSTHRSAAVVEVVRAAVVVVVAPVVEVVRAVVVVVVAPVVEVVVVAPVVEVGALEVVGVVEVVEVVEIVQPATAAVMTASAAAETECRDIRTPIRPPDSGPMLRGRCGTSGRSALGRGHRTDDPERRGVVA